MSLIIISTAEVVRIVTQQPMYMQWHLWHVVWGDQSITLH